MDHKQTANLLALIKTAFPEFTITQEVIALWCNYLKDVPASLAQFNLDNHIRTSRFAPRIADIVHEDPLPSQSYYDLLKQEQESERIALETYEQQAVPMPDHIRARLNGLVEKKRVITDES